jgi:putative ATP-binding cassette transporter
VKTIPVREFVRTADAQPLLRLLRQGSGRFGLELLSIVALSGLANAVLLAIINAAAENASNEAANGRYLWLFTVVIIAFILTQRYILMTSVLEVERILHRIRVSVSDRIRRASLFGLERIGRSEIYGSVNRETVTISQAAATLIIACQSALMIVFSMLYLAWLSMTAFFLTVALTYIGLLMHFRKAAEFNALLQEANTRENRFFDGLTDLLDGFKEIKLRASRAEAIEDRLRTMSMSLAEVKIQSGTSFAEHYIFAQAAFYLLIGGIVFLLPRITPTYAGVVMKATAAVLFIIGPLSSLVGALPIFSRANVAAANIVALEAALEQSAGHEPPPAPGAVARPAGAFDEIALSGITFQYEDARGGSPFSIGPADLTIRRGEILFVIGGNGSGKSTFLKVLTGLYAPLDGAIAVDRSTITPAEVAWYREHFSAVFSDYHLFEELFGLESVEPARVQALLELMQIDHKTQFVDGRFTTLDLSAGQRKRLALVVSILEDRPVLVLDEWAADQDPPFREFFYREILPDLRRRGKTIVAVTHDDKYFDAADRVLKMDYGQFVAYAAV